MNSLQFRQVNTIVIAVYHTIDYPYSTGHDCLCLVKTDLYNGLERQRQLVLSHSDIELCGPSWDKSHLPVFFQLFQFFNLIKFSKRMVLLSGQDDSFWAVIKVSPCRPKSKIAAQYERLIRSQISNNEIRNCEFKSSFLNQMFQIEAVKCFPSF